MGHRFGDLVTQHLSRKHGLSQNKLAEGIDEDASVVSKMCKGERLSGKLARGRVLKIITWFHQQDTLTFIEEANAFLIAADMLPLKSDVSQESDLLKKLSKKPKDPEILSNVVDC